MPAQISAVPSCLVDPSGKVAAGVFSAPVGSANLEAAQPTVCGLRLPHPLARLRLKSWHHYALILPEAFVGLAVVDTGYLRTSWCFVVDRRTNRSAEHARLGPLLDLHVPEDLWLSTGHVRSRGYQVELASRLAQGEHELGLEIDGGKGRPEVRGRLRCLHALDRVKPLAVCLPLGEGRFMYSHKVALPLEGELAIGGERLRASPETSCAILDVHKAHYPHHTFWRWATFAGRDARGRLLALNLTKNVVTDDERWNENAVWCDGEVEPLGAARFSFNEKNVLAPWKLETSCGSVSLTFRPQGERKQSLKLGLIRSVFHQPYGAFTGTVRFRGETLAIEQLFGLCEDHDSLW